MDIQLGTYKNINSINVDKHNRIELLNKASLMTDYDMKNVISASDVFDAEREANSVYRIYGKIEYLSLFNGLKLNYSNVTDFFNPLTTNNRNIYNTFEFYLLRPITLTNILDLSGNSTTKYVRTFEVVATPNEFELFNVGFTNNVYGEQEYCFSFNEDFDVSEYFDSLNFPVTELFLFPLFKPKTNGFPLPESSITETLNRFNWNSTSTPTIVPVEIYLQLSIGDTVYGDIVTYNKAEFTQTILSGQTYQIKTAIHTGSTTSVHYLYWKYNPFISLRLRYFSNDLQRANSGSTSYDIVQSIPEYATLLYGDNFVWRNVLPQGYYDPITDLGVDYPFINKRRYLFTTIIIDLIPDLSDDFTHIVFTNIKLGNSIKINDQPKGDINDIGKPC